MEYVFLQQTLTITCCYIIDVYYITYIHNITVTGSVNDVGEKYKTKRYIPSTALGARNLHTILLYTCQIINCMLHSIYVQRSRWFKVVLVSSVCVVVHLSRYNIKPRRRDAVIYHF